MIEHKVEPNVMIYSALLNVCAKAAQPERAEAWLADMRERGISPNVVCFNNVIDACARAVQPDRAESWLNQLCECMGTESTDLSGQRQIVRPTKQSFTTTARPFAMRGLYQDAERIFKRMEDMDLPMDEFSITVLISAYS